MRMLSLILVMLVSTSCFRLDDLLYRPSDAIDAYLLDDYEGEVEIEVGEEYNIPDSLIHVLTINSDLNGDVAELYAVYIGDISSIDEDTVILYLHGTRDHMDFYWPRAKLLANTGGKARFGVLMIDYRGYGLSEGEPSEEGLYVDSDAAMAWLKANGLTDDRLIVYGFSLGSAPATELAANPRSMTVSKLMLEAPFASAEVMVQDGSGLSLPGTFFTDLEIDNAEEIKKVDQPFFWIHGIADSFLAMDTHGEVVFKNYGGDNAVAVRVEGGEHGDVPFVMGYDAYLQAVESFILAAP